MKRFVLAAVFLFALAAQAKVNVVATVNDLGELVKEVGGDNVELTVLAKPTQDPHFVDAKHSLVISLARADLVVQMGMELEVGWLPTLLTSSRNGKIQVGSPGNLDCSTFIRPLDVPTVKIERSMGDIHPAGNPHYTKDPRNGIAIAKGIAARLSEIDPEHSNAYAANAAKFEASLNGKISEWQKAFAPYKAAPIITFHQSWKYFSDWAGLTEVAYMEPKPGLPPSAQHVAEVIVAGRQKHAKLILQEEWYSAQTSQLVADKTGAALVVVSGMVPEGQTYAQYLDSLVQKTTAALAGTK
ncbi:MAG: metal ABC transporter substrate-binding protein [Myxococcaceae bacterium]